jgi:hypothetical protein
MPGMDLHCGQVWCMACEARDRAIAAVSENPNVWPTDAIVAIVLAAASTEAFINEFAEFIDMWGKNDPSLREMLSPAVRACADALIEIEAARGTLTLKYLVASLVLCGKTFDKGSNPYQDFATLIKLRNDLMHLKPQDVFVHAPDANEMEVPKYIEALSQRGLAYTPATRVGVSWFDRLHTVDMAKWACATAHAIILAVLAMTPDDPVPARDPLFMLKRMFRE